MSLKERHLSTADLRKETVINSAMTLFAKTGYFGTTVADVAKGAGISSAYVFRLFPSKEELFLAALDRCYTTIVNSVMAIAGVSQTRDSQAVLDAIGAMYAQLIGDSTLIMLQVQAQCVATIPTIRTAVHQGLKMAVEAIAQRSEADPAEIQRMMAYGQLCHLIVVAGLHKVDAKWANTLTQGMLHPEG